MPEIDLLDVLQAYLPALVAAVEDSNESTAAYLLSRIDRELKGELEAEEESENASVDDLTAYLLS